eukprot:GHVU01148212.1.p1 GENE.GHVU01148212.1~~GHVU01148212.1.p1  ORF type:complete len:243 (+),score=12.38 GHVU01148212.1:222-950(+)
MLPPRRLRRRETGTLRTWENDGGRSNLYVLFGAVLGWLLLAVSLCRASNVGFHLKMEVCDDNGNYTDCYNIIKGEVELDSQATTASLAAWSPPVKLPDDSLANVKIQDPAGRGFSLFFEKEPVMFENPLIESPATLWWSYHEATMHFGALEMTCPMGNVPPHVVPEGTANEWDQFEYNIDWGRLASDLSVLTYNHWRWNWHRYCVDFHLCYGFWDQRSKTGVLGGRPQAGTSATAAAVTYCC